MKRPYYSASISQFMNQSPSEILGELVNNNSFSTDDLQKNTWNTEIALLKHVLVNFTSGHIILEYTIPRIGSRADAVLLYRGIVFLLEFKVGSDSYPSSAVEQVIDYALDFNYFHKKSHNKLIAPILLCTEAPPMGCRVAELKKNILNVSYCNGETLQKTIEQIASQFPRKEFSAAEWMDSIYMPTPTIIEAAQALYRGHKVEDISRKDASAINLTETKKSMGEIINYSKQNRRKSICFVTGVPGSGKTLVGLDIAIDRQRVDEGEHAVFLSGNGPLVAVLQESLARDDGARTGSKKNEALRKSKEFIQIIHHFRDEVMCREDPPIEKVVIFDEAQRAWTEQSLTNFMQRKKNLPNFNMSEPEFLISVMDRHKDWTTIVCLIGGGQEINTGEAGLSEWFEALKTRFSKWDVYISDKITDDEYVGDKTLEELLGPLNYKIVRGLHLAVSLRSFRSEKVSEFVKAVLDIDPQKASALYADFHANYPIYITRDLDEAKRWLIDQAKGSERYGMIASSGAKRLRTHGIWVQNKVDAPLWFLNGKEDVRSSYFLEETATEFDIQGLELDWCLLCWDANLRFSDGRFTQHTFKGGEWKNINKKEDKLYLKNAYRVLMTRARQGFVIFVPPGDIKDKTRNPNFYDGVYEYFIQIGLKKLSNEIIEKEK